MSGNMALVVDRRGAALELGTHGTLVLRFADGRRERVGLHALGAVVLHGDVQISTGVLQALAAAGAGLSVLPLRGKAPAVGFTQLPHRHATLRHWQHLAYADPQARIALARLVVEAKVRAMANFADNRAPAAGDAWMPALAALHGAQDIASLMGVEGAATQKHFANLRCAYAADASPFQFDGRSRQPPKDEPNALMSLGYTLAQAQAAQLALHAGLDVQLGFLHGLQRDRQSLALDLLEPARAAVDAWVHTLLSTGALVPSMFARSPDGGMRLTAEGRAAFYPRWFAEGHRRVQRPMRDLLARMVASLRGLARSDVPAPADPCATATLRMP